MAYYLHRSPWWFHHFETLSNHFLELVVPFFLFLGRRMCILHGVLQILFQVGCARVPPLGVPVCLQKTRACLIISELAPRGVASSAPPAGAPLHLIQAVFQDPLPSFHEPTVVSGCPQGAACRERHRPCSGTPLFHTDTPCVLGSNPRTLGVLLYIDKSLLGIG